MTLWRRILIVEEWTEMGAVVSDLFSSHTFHLSLTRIEEDFYPFVHTSPEGKDGDITLLIHAPLLQRLK